MMGYLQYRALFLRALSIPAGLRPFMQRRQNYYDILHY
ncbi:hypothetical protein SAMN06298226_2618 [Nitrosovibrio sp. Nv4]|nr:hypothetical protein SAMN06298226_2618 [Nitrosovibrio sp. Nv4]